ncbi:MAG: fibronectin type III domain-containing protein, partial [Clostridia bacterium]
SAILVSDSPNSDGNYEIVWNRAPSTPDGISVPATCYSGQYVTVTWGGSIDEDGDAITYTLERSTNSGSYTQVTSTSARTYSDMVSTTWNTLQYRVKAVDAVGNASAYITSSTAAVVHNQPPVISGSNADLGIKRQEFSHAYTVTDADGDVVTVVEAIDGKAFNTRAVTLGAENICIVSGNTFTGLINAAHTLTITATDSAGNRSVRTLTFTKAINGFEITPAKPLTARQHPTRCNVVVTRDIPAGGTFKVEACNNPFDGTPVWEDCTNAVLQGTAYVFKNDVNTAIECGLSIRVTVGRADALTTCWVSGIGGNFE